MTASTRRSFIATAAAAAVLPAGARAALGDWREALAQLPALRAAYLDEVGRLALTLEPRFRSGELHAYREDDDLAQRKRDVWYESPEFEIGAAFGRHFRIGVNGDEGDPEIARVLLALSPHAHATGDGSDVDPRDHAREAGAWDVIVHARRAGWYVPTPDETTGPGLVEEDEA